MHLQKMLKNRLGLLMVALTLVLFTSACDNDNEPVTTDDSAVVVDSEAETETDTETMDADAEATVAVEEEADTEESGVMADEVDAVSTEVMTDTITDTDVITRMEVITEVEAAEIEVETTVMTDTDVTVDRSTDTESDTTVETEDIDTSAETAIIVMADSAGNSFLADPVEQRPYFVSEQEGMIDHEDFEPVEMSEDIILDENLDQELFGELDQLGMTVVTFNGMPLYRYTGLEDSDWQSIASELGLRQITPEGELGDMAN